MAWRLIPVEEQSKLALSTRSCCGISEERGDGEGMGRGKERGKETNVVSKVSECSECSECSGCSE